METVTEYNLMEVSRNIAISFAKWLNKNGWREYDEADRWICPTDSFRVFTTEQLFEMFELPLL